MDFCGQVINYPLRVSLPHILLIIISCHYYLPLFLKKKKLNHCEELSSLSLSPPSPHVILFFLIS